MIEAKDILAIGKYIEQLGLLDLEVIKAAKDMFNTNDGIDAFFTSNIDFGKDSVSFKLHFEKEENADTIQLHGYEADKLSVPIPPVKMGNFDSFKLDKSLSEIDWNLPIEQLLSLPGIADVYMDLLNHTRHEEMEVRQTARLLMLKHWKNKSIEQSIDGFPDAKRFEMRMYVPLFQDPNDINIIKAYNLLSGRAVLQINGENKESNDLYWLMIRDGKLVKVDGFDIMIALETHNIQKPKSEAQRSELLQNVFSGSLAKATFLLKNKEIMGFIHADPLNKRFALFDANGSPLDTENKICQRQRKKAENRDFLSGKSLPVQQRKASGKKGRRL